MDRACRLPLIVLAVRAPGLTLPAVSVVVWAAGRLRPARGSDVHGTARWCSEEDACRAGLL